MGILQEKFRRRLFPLLSGTLEPAAPGSSSCAEPRVRSRAEEPTAAPSLNYQKIKHMSPFTQARNSMLIRPDSIYFNYRQGQAPPSPHREPGRLNSPGEVSSPQGRSIPGMAAPLNPMVGMLEAVDRLGRYPGTLGRCSAPCRGYWGHGRGKFLGLWVDS